MGARSRRFLATRADDQEQRGIQDERPDKEDWNLFHIHEKTSAGMKPALALCLGFRSGF